MTIMNNFEYHNDILTTLSWILKGLFQVGINCLIVHAHSCPSNPRSHCHVLRLNIAAHHSVATWHIVTRGKNSNWRGSRVRMLCLMLFKRQIANIDNLLFGVRSSNFNIISYWLFYSTQKHTKLKSR